MVEGARLESVFTGNRNAGSNPALSAIICPSKYMLSCVHPARVWLDVAKVATNGLGTSPSLHQSDKSYTEVDDRLTNEAQRILRGDRSVNLPERRSAYEESGWMGFDPRAEPLEDIEAERDRVP